MQYKHNSALVAAQERKTLWYQRFETFVRGDLCNPRDSQKRAYEAHVRMVGNEAMGRWMTMLRYGTRMSQRMLSEVLGYQDHHSVYIIEQGLKSLDYERYVRMYGVLGGKVDVKDTFPITGQETEGELLVNIWPYLSAEQQDNLYADLMVGKKNNSYIGQEAHNQHIMVSEEWMKEAFVRVYALKVARDALKVENETKAARVREIENRLAELEGRLKPHEDAVWMGGRAGKALTSMVA